MSHTPNDLADAFPAQAEKLHLLRLSDPRFARFADDYRDLNRAIHRMESGIEPVADTVLEMRKKERLKLLDEIGSALAAV